MFDSTFKLVNSQRFLGKLFVYELGKVLGTSCHPLLRLPTLNPLQSKGRFDLLFIHLTHCLLSHFIEIRQEIHMSFLPKFWQHNNCNMDPLGMNSDPHITSSIT